MIKWDSDSKPHAVEIVNEGAGEYKTKPKKKKKNPKKQTCCMAQMSRLKLASVLEARLDAVVGEWMVLRQRSRGATWRHSRRAAAARQQSGGATRRCSQRGRRGRSGGSLGRRSEAWRLWTRRACLRWWSPWACLHAGDSSAWTAVAQGCLPLLLPEVPTRALSRAPATPCALLRAKPNGTRAQDSNE